MFKINKLLSVILMIFVVTGCSGSLPTRHDSAPGAGVLAIPVSMNSNGVPVPPTWLMDFEIWDAGSDVIGKPVTLLPYEGRRIVYVPGLQAGSYQVKRVRTASRRTGAVNAGVNPFQELTKGIEFDIEAGAVTVLPVILHYKRDFTGAETISTSYEFRNLLEDIEQFKTVLNGSRNIDGWNVNWPE